MVLPAMRVQEAYMEYIFNTHDSFPLPRPRREEVEKLLLRSRMTKFVNAEHVDNVQMCRKPSAVFKPDISGGQGAVWVGCVVCAVLLGVGLFFRNISVCLLRVSSGIFFGGGVIPICVPP